MPPSGTQLITLTQGCDNEFIREFIVHSLRVICRRAEQVPAVVANLPAGLPSVLQLIADMFHVLQRCKCKDTPGSVRRPSADTVQRTFDGLEGFRRTGNPSRNPQQPGNREEITFLRCAFARGMQEAGMVRVIPNDVANLMWNLLEAFCFALNQIRPVPIDIESMDEMESSSSSLSTNPSR